MHGFLFGQAFIRCHLVQVQPVHHVDGTDHKVKGIAFRNFVFLFCQMGLHPHLDAQQHVVALTAKRLQQRLCQLGIETRLRGSDRQHETTDKQHDDWVGKTCHDTLIVEKLSGITLRSLQEVKGGIANTE